MNRRRRSERDVDGSGRGRRVTHGLGDGQPCLNRPGRAAEMGLLGGDLGLHPLDLGLHLGDIVPQFLERQAVQLARCRGLLAGFEFLGIHIASSICQRVVAFKHSSAEFDAEKRHAANGVAGEPMTDSMIAIEIAGFGGTRGLEAGRAARAPAGEGRTADRGRRGRRQPARRDAAPGRLQAAAGRFRHSGAGGCGPGRGAGRGGVGLAGGRSGDRLGRRRRLCRILHRTRAAMPADPQGVGCDPGRGAARDLLHRLDQCLRSRPPP